MAKSKHKISSQNARIMAIYTPSIHPEKTIPLTDTHQNKEPRVLPDFFENQRQEQAMITRELYYQAQLLDMNQLISIIHDPVALGQFQLQVWHVLHQEYPLSVALPSRFVHRIVLLALNNSLLSSQWSVQKQYSQELRYIQHRLEELDSSERYVLDLAGIPIPAPVR
jgi:hypothetical protein